MQAVKPQMDVWLQKPAKLQSSYKRKELKHMYEGKRCQDTVSEYNDSKGQSTVKMFSDKNCQENENSNLRSVNKKMDMWLPKPAIRRLCSNKN